MTLITLTTIELTEQFCHLITWQYQRRDQQRDWHLTAEAQIPLSWPIVADFDGQNHQQSVKSVREIVHGALAPAGSVIVMIPEHQVLYKSVSLPADLSLAKSQQALQQAVSQSLSCPMDAVHWDALRVTNAENGQREVDLCVVRQAVIDACQRCFRALHWPLDMVIPKSALPLWSEDPLSESVFPRSDLAKSEHSEFPSSDSLCSASPADAGPLSAATLGREQAKRRLEHRAACEYFLGWQGRYQPRSLRYGQRDAQTGQRDAQTAKAPRTPSDEAGAATINLMPWHKDWQVQQRRRDQKQLLASVALMLCALLSGVWVSEPVYQQRQAHLLELQAHTASLRHQVQVRQNEAAQLTAWSQAWALWQQQQARHHELWHAWHQTTDWLEDQVRRGASLQLLNWQWQPEQWAWQVELPVAQVAPPFLLGRALNRRVALGPLPVSAPFASGWQHWHYRFNRHLSRDEKSGEPLSGLVHDRQASHATPVLNARHKEVKGG
ncbi:MULTISPECIES: hypothetical protein [unclassified Vibrio]|uniref:Uncharacterized protein n=1 Tax=Vibrio sp. HB236076 TaxID=3232307 RepID=A0AB39HHZ4_9VIBR|nr:hypothetical protein [Vibrio sp. HB161653]MDP5255765.1 hypothetical protein [Vibrio sp. HB161653]